jgi:hypothetical protein
VESLLVALADSDIDDINRMVIIFFIEDDFSTQTYKKQGSGNVKRKDSKKIKGAGYIPDSGFYLFMY